MEYLQLYSETIGSSLRRKVRVAYGLTPDPSDQDYDDRHRLPPFPDRVWGCPSLPTLNVDAVRSYRHEVTALRAQYQALWRAKTLEHLGRQVSKPPSCDKENFQSPVSGADSATKSEAESCPPAHDYEQPRGQKVCRGVKTETSPPPPPVENAVSLGRGLSASSGLPSAEEGGDYEGVGPSPSCGAASHVVLSVDDSYPRAESDDGPGSRCDGGEPIIHIKASYPDDLRRKSEEEGGAGGANGGDERDSQAKTTATSENVGEKERKEESDDDAEEASVKLLLLDDFRARLGELRRSALLRRQMTLADVLAESRTFRSPLCSPSMAEALHVQRVYDWGPAAGSATASLMRLEDTPALKAALKHRTQRNATEISIPIQKPTVIQGEGPINSGSRSLGEEVYNTHGIASNTGGTSSDRSWMSGFGDQQDGAFPTSGRLSDTQGQCPGGGLPLSYPTSSQEWRVLPPPSPPQADAAGKGKGDAPLSREAPAAVLARALQAEDEGLDIVRKTLKVRITRCWALEAVYKGVALARAGSDAEALRCYAMALEMDPGNAEALVANGAALANLDRFTEALQSLREAVAADPNHPNAKAYLDAVQRKYDSVRQEAAARDNRARERQEEAAREQARIRQDEPKERERPREEARGGERDGERGGDRRPAFGILLTASRSVEAAPAGGHGRGRVREEEEEEEEGFLKVQDGWAADGLGSAKKKRMKAEYVEKPSRASRSRWESKDDRGIDGGEDEVNHWRIRGDDDRGRRTSSSSSSDSSSSDDDSSSSSSITSSSSDEVSSGDSDVVSLDGEGEKGNRRRKKKRMRHLATAGPVAGAALDLTGGDDRIRTALSLVVGSAVSVHRGGGGHRKRKKHRDRKEGHSAEPRDEARRRRKRRRKEREKEREKRSRRKEKKHKRGRKERHGSTSKRRHPAKKDE